MNFNASRNVGQPGGLRKAKRVSDVAALGAPTPTTSFPPGPTYNPGFAPAGPPPPYHEGIEMDTSQNYGQPPAAGNFGYMSAPYSPASVPSPSQINTMLQQPIVQDMALQYGNQLAAQGKEVVKREFGRYVPVSRLRYYFAVDTRYVLKKLLLIMFPYTHQEWMVKYDQDMPVQPRYDINAPDLYIPTMGYVTYVLLAGFMLGIQHKFSPEQISIQASSAFAYILFEMVIYLVTLYITNTHTSLKTLDLLAFSGYKYIAMITSLLAGLLFTNTGYYCGLVYTSCALSYFLVKTLRLQLLSGSQGGGPAPQYRASDNPYSDTWTQSAGAGGGVKRRLYFLLFVAVTQPLLSWWLTYHLVPASAALSAAQAAAR